MRKALVIPVWPLFAVALVVSLTVVARAQNREKFIISAQAGGVNAVTGRATMRSRGNSEWKQLTIKEDLEAGDVVMTGVDGRVEMLLNPGSYMRVGENSEFELADNSLENLEVRLLRGTAIVEVTGADDSELLIGITTPQTHMSIVRRGLYRVNVVPGDATELIVRKGRVMLDGSHTKIKGGNKVVFSSNSFSIAKLEKTNKKKLDTLEDWSRVRAQTLAEANSKLPGKTLNAFVSSLVNDWSGSSFWGRSGIWFYNPTTVCYTFLPFGYGWGSPYGGFYSRSFYGVGYYGGNGIYPGVGLGGVIGGSSSGSGSSGGSTRYPPPSSGSGRVQDSPTSGHGRPEITHGPVREHRDY
ncbi:MAG TPA: hypothetical protein DCK93_21255 [Blastocatellia bacterium]|nr:hypothetical protein [Blastocatellia bacterium]HAF25401.1 hypothetical protein [Blastocatellia bacterium]